MGMNNVFSNFKHISQLQHHELTNQWDCVSDLEICTKKIIFSLLMDKVHLKLWITAH